LGDLLRAGSAVRGDQPGCLGVEGVGDVDDDLAGQRVPVLGDDRHGAGVRHREDDDVAGRGGAECPGRGAAAERGGHGLGRGAADDLDGVAASERPAGEGAGHVPQADNADAAHGVPAFWSWIAGQNATPTPLLLTLVSSTLLLTLVSSTPLNDAMNGTQLHGATGLSGCPR